MWLDDWKKSKQIKFGQREVISSIESITRANTVIDVRCSCGGISHIPAYTFYKNASTRKTCGKCLVNKAAINRITTFGDLTTRSISVDDRVNIKIEAVCRCGNAIHASLRQLLIGKRKSCGKCVIKSIGSVHGNLTVTDDLSKVSSTKKRISVRCKCGNTSSVILRNLITGNTKSCGKCDVTEFKKFGQIAFGNLIVIESFDSITKMTQTVSVECKCGNITRKKLTNVVNGHTTSCGNCYTYVRKWWTENSEELQKTKFPLSDSPVHRMFQSDTLILNGKTKINGVCSICGENWNPVFNDIVRGVSLSCGCGYNRVSTQQREIYDLVQEYASSELEFKIGDFHYDVVVPSKKLVFEFHGLKWHSTNESRKTDFKKFTEAKNHGYDVTVIFEDEWLEKKEIMKQVILNKLGVTVTRLSNRPNRCTFTNPSSRELNDFYERNHYIGKTNASINYAASIDNNIVAALSLRSPNRQSRHQYELTRMASDPSVRVHGIWSKMFNKFVSDHKPASVVSFSDNRLFSGSVYSKMGFELDGEVRPDYYWTKDRKRYHKSGLRKSKGETGTENDLRINQGFRKIWDYGKTRWVWARDKV